jgi:hypothetical protein
VSAFTSVGSEQSRFEPGIAHLRKPRHGAVSAVRSGDRATNALPKPGLLVVGW